MTSETSTWQDIKAAVRGTQEDYTRGPIGRAVLLLAVPMVLETAMESLFAIVDVFIEPGCGACIGCGPGVSETAEQVTVSAINRNYKGRSGPGRLYLASPLTVAASAFTGRITEFTPGMFAVPETVGVSSPR